METDGTLIERSCRGRPDAFVEVVRRHEIAVHGFLARRAGPQVAADLLGEVWLRAFAGRGGYDPAHPDARPWLYGIALGVRDALWILQGIFAASALFLLTPRIRAARDLPGYEMSASKAASAAGTSPTYSGGASV